MLSRARELGSRLSQLGSYLSKNTKTIKYCKKIGTHFTIINRVALTIAIIMLAASTMLVVYLVHIAPNYNGNLTLDNAIGKVDIFYDKFAIPHIYASHEEDAFRALGYIHAQERLFQMELLRRVGQGRLAEIFGENFVHTDKTFRTFGFTQLAHKLSQQYLSNDSQPYQKAALAYIDGINQFIEYGNTPIEFTMLNIPKEKFTREDIFLITAYLSFNFTEGFNIAPAIQQIRSKLGDEYLAEFDLNLPEQNKYPENLPGKIITAENFKTNVPTMLSELPISLWAGSNAWAISSKKTKSGKPILVNDTHMGFVQPTAWFEAHIETPNFNFYGNFVAGFPFGLVGHNNFSTWGLTVLGNDDTIFYKEKFHPQNTNKVKYKEQWEDVKLRKEIIKVKDAKDVIMWVKETRHGPIINDVITEWASIEIDPVSVSWSLFNEPGNLLKTTYELAHADSMQRARNAVSKMGAPGLNVLYADIDGNIAHWIMARIMKFPENIFTSFLLDGSSGMEEAIGYYSFEENPNIENPASGILVSANNSFGAMPDGKQISGYFAPDDRAESIYAQLELRDDWTIKDMESLIMDDTSLEKVTLANSILAVISNDSSIHQSATHEQALVYLKNWDGRHELDSIAPTIYYKLIYNISQKLFQDVLGNNIFDSFINTNLLERSLPDIIQNTQSIWWQTNPSSKIQMHRKEFLIAAYLETIDELSTQLGNDASKWQWGKVHVLEHQHPFGKVKALEKIFNVGPFSVSGGNEVINTMGFELNDSGIYRVNFGPAMRIIIDLADMENSYSISPTGQSGYILSQHYADQAELYIHGKFRKQLMNKNEILSNFEGKLTFYPG